MDSAPDPKDVLDYQFKLSKIQQLCKITNVPAACSLVATDGKRGLLYTGHENKITVLRCNNQTAAEWKFEHELPSIISRIAVSCDCEYVSVTFVQASARIYSAKSLTSGDNLELLHEIQISQSSSNVFAYDLKWNPTVPGMFCTIASDHTIGTFAVNSERKSAINLMAMKKIEGLGILSAAWSPKGRQIVVGCENGNIVQLKQDLEIARTIPCPTTPVGGVISILWISNYQFCACYQDPKDRTIRVLIVDAPKGKATANFRCYDDITYGTPENETDPNLYSRYYMEYIGESQWGLIIAASSSSSEIAVLGTTDNGTTWTQWQLNDNCRAQLPLIHTSETFPIGITIDRSSDTKLSLSPELTLEHPVPNLHIFGTSGQLITYHMVDLRPNCPNLCTPPREIVNSVQTQISQPRMSLLPSEISFNMNSAATSTPRVTKSPAAAAAAAAAAAEVAAETSKNLPSTKLFAEPPKSPGAQTVQTVDQKMLKRPLSPVDESQATTTTSSPEKPSIDERVCMNAYYEEHMLFEKELASKLKTQNWECGTESERKMIMSQAARMDEFLSELRKTWKKTLPSSTDVAVLKGLLLQSFAWLEESKSKNLANSRGENASDRCDRSRIRELSNLLANVESSLMKATKALDIQWAERESREKSQVKVPSLEFIYQSLQTHWKIITKEKTNIDEYSRKWKSITRSSGMSRLDKSMSNMSLSSNSGTGETATAIQSRCKSIAANTRNFTVEKQLELRDLLLTTAPRVIRAVNPSPAQDRLEASLSALAAHQSTQIVPPIAQKLPLPEPKPVQQSPLASLNNIVAKFDAPVDSATARSIGITFSMGQQPHFPGSPNLETKKVTSTVVTQTTKTVAPATAKISSVNPPVSARMPSNPRSQAFSEPLTVPKFSEAKTTSQLSTDFSINSAKIVSPPKDNFSFFTALCPPSQETKAPLTPAATAKKTERGSSGFLSSLPESTTIQPVAPFGTCAASKIDDAIAPPSLQTFSFASKNPSKMFSFDQITSKLPGTLNFDLASIGTSTSSIGSKNSSSPSNKSGFAILPTPPITAVPPPMTELPPASATNIFGGSASTTTSAEIIATNAPSIFTAGSTLPSSGASSTELTSSLFGALTATSPGITSTFASATPIATSAETPVFSAAPVFPTAATTTPESSKIIAHVPTSPTSTFGKLALNFSSPPPPPPPFGAIPSSGVATTINFGSAVASSSSFQNPGQISSGTFGDMANAAKPIIGPPQTNVFAGATGTSSNNSVFGSVAATPGLGIFGGGNVGASSPFKSETNTSPFGSQGSAASIFGGGVQKSPSSIFGGASAAGAAPVSAFGGAANTQTVSPQATAAFGQSPTFSAKPLFGGQQSVFGAATPNFSNPFGQTTFGAMPSGFSGPPTMGASPPPLGTASMEKVFGSPAGTSTFESLAGQNGGLTFGSLAPQAQEPQNPPSFSGGSSFSSWR